MQELRHLNIELTFEVDRAGKDCAAELLDNGQALARDG